MVGGALESCQSAAMACKSCERLGAACETKAMGDATTAQPQLARVMPRPQLLWLRNIQVQRPPSPQDGSVHAYSKQDNQRTQYTYLG